MRKLWMAIGMAALLGPAAHAASEVNGVISVEAENYTSQSGYRRLANSGASGSAVMQVIGGSDSKLNFQIDVAQGGTWHVWIRTYATSAENNGLKLGLDGRGLGDVYLHKGSWSWQPEWSGTGSPITISLAAGQHVLWIQKRKVENPLIDKIVLTKSATAPSGYGPGSTGTSTNTPAPPTPSASLSIGPDAFVVPFDGASRRPILVTTATTSLTWTASTTANWITVTSGRGTGNGTVDFNVASNSGAFRSGMIRVSDGTFARTCAVYQLSGTNFPARANDFDGDGAADAATFSPTDGKWNCLYSGGGSDVFAYGWSTVKPVPADYDGDGKVDAAVYQPNGGGWYLRQSSAGNRTATFGWSSAVPVPADYDGDGVADLAVYDPDSGAWYFRYSTGRPDVSAKFGWWKSMIPVPADYDGDGKVDLAVYQPAAGNWYWCESSTGYVVHRAWGWNGAIPVPGDYDGDGLADIAVYNRADAMWYVAYAAGGSLSYAFGWPEVIPAPADFDGDGATDLAVYHEAGGKWYALSSDTGATLTRTNGGAGKAPVLLNNVIRTWFDLP